MRLGEKIESILFCLRTKCKQRKACRVSPRARVSVCSARWSPVGRGRAKPTQTGLAKTSTAVGNGESLPVFFLFVCFLHTYILHPFMRVWDSYKGGYMASVHPPKQHEHGLLPSRQPPEGGLTWAGALRDAGEGRARLPQPHTNIHRRTLCLCVWEARLRSTSSRFIYVSFFSLFSVFL